MVWASFRDFVKDLLRHWYVLLPALALDPFDLVETYTDLDWSPPVWLMWTVFAISAVLAAWLAYRDVWTRVQPDRLVDLLWLRDRGEILVQWFETMESAIKSHGTPGGQEEVAFVQDFCREQLEPWLSEVRMALTTQELAAFDRRESLGPADCESLTDMMHLVHITNVWSKRLRTICEAAQGAMSR